MKMEKNAYQVRKTIPSRGNSRAQILVNYTKRVFAMYREEMKRLLENGGNIL